MDRITAHLAIAGKLAAAKAPPSKAKRPQVSRLCPRCRTAFEPVNGNQRYCGRKCYLAAYRAANRGRIAKHQAAYCAANRERIAKHKAAYDTANRPRIAKYQAAYRAANRERIA